MGPSVIAGSSAVQRTFIMATGALPPKAEYLGLASTSLPSSPPSLAFLLATGAGFFGLLHTHPERDMEATTAPAHAAVARTGRARHDSK